MCVFTVYIKGARCRRVYYALLPIYTVLTLSSLFHNMSILNSVRSYG